MKALSMDWFAFVNLLGAAQGVFLAAVLAGRRPFSIPNRLLAVSMLAFALDLGVAVYHTTGIDVAFPHLIGIDFPLAFLYGPLLYLYARTLSNPASGFRRAYLWHFLPFVALALMLLPFYVQSGADKLAFLHAPSDHRWMQGLDWVNHLKMVHAALYIGSILVLLRRHRRRVRDRFSFTEHVNLNWLRDLVIGIIGLMGFTVVLYLMALGTARPVIGLDPATHLDDYTLLGLAVFVYAIGFMGLRQPEFFGSQWTGREMPPPTPTAASPDEAPKPRYAKSGMDTETAEQCKRDLLALMEMEKPYRRGDLTLQDLADALSVSPHNLTEIINTRIGLNFYDFVNGYRVQEVKERLVDPQNAHLTLLAIGMEAGFNAKSSFNAVFKKHTGETPSQFRQQHHAAR